MKYSFWNRYDLARTSLTFEPNRNKSLSINREYPYNFTSVKFDVQNNLFMFDMCIFSFYYTRVIDSGPCPLYPSEGLWSQWMRTSLDCRHRRDPHQSLSIVTGESDTFLITCLPAIVASTDHCPSVRSSQQGHWPVDSCHCSGVVIRLVRVFESEGRATLAEGSKTAIGTFRTHLEHLNRTLAHYCANSALFMMGLLLQIFC